MIGIPGHGIRSLNEVFGEDGECGAECVAEDFNLVHHDEGRFVVPEIMCHERADLVGAVDADCAVIG